MRARRTAAIGLATALALAPVSASGFMDDVSSGMPPELEELGRQLEASFAAAEVDALARQKWAGTLCAHHPCAQNVTEAQAKDLLVAYQMQEQRKSERWLSWVGIVTSLLSAAAALYAIRETHQSEKLAREADRRSLRSEARLDRIKAR